jgi:hypothetical protein
MLPCTRKARPPNICFSPVRAGRRAPPGSGWLGLRRTPSRDPFMDGLARPGSCRRRTPRQGREHRPGAPSRRARTLRHVALLGLDVALIPDRRTSRPKPKSTADRHLAKISSRALPWPPGLLDCCDSATE